MLRARTEAQRRVGVLKACQFLPRLITREASTTPGELKVTALLGCSTAGYQGRGIREGFDEPTTQRYVATTRRKEQTSKVQNPTMQQITANHSSGDNQLCIHQSPRVNKTKTSRGRPVGVRSQLSFNTNLVVANVIYQD